MSVHVHVFCCSPSYPCDMVTVLHLVLYKTADLDFTTRERATHLLQILDKRLANPQLVAIIIFLLRIHPRINPLPSSLASQVLVQVLLPRL